MINQSKNKNRQLHVYAFGFEIRKIDFILCINKINDRVC